MTSPQTPFRVAMASEFRSENSYGSFMGVLDYKQQVGHWQLVGHIQNPVIAFEDIDFKNIDGVIGFFRQQSWADAAINAGVAAVNFSNAVYEIPLPRVGNDDHAIGALGGEHLLERGFVHFGFIMSPHTWYSHRRLEGFERVIVRGAERQCHVLDTMRSANDISSIKAWLDRMPRPIGVMAANDVIGCHAIEAALSLGLNVPDDVAVVGVDNDRWLTQFAPKPMSSIEPDWRQIGYKAAQMLDALMHGQTPESPRWVPPLRAVTRHSSDIVVAQDPIVAQALRYIRDHFARGIGVESVLDVVGVSRRNLESRMKRSVGHTPYTVICRVQIEHAKKLLVETRQTMAQVAQACGIGQEQFYPVFKRITGMTPGDYRQRFS